MKKIWTISGFYPRVNKISTITAKVDNFVFYNYFFTKISMKTNKEYQIYEFVFRTAEYCNILWESKQNISCYFTFVCLYEYVQLAIIIKKENAVLIPTNWFWEWRDQYSVSGGWGCARKFRERLFGLAETNSNVLCKKELPSSLISTVFGRRDVR